MRDRWHWYCAGAIILLGFFLMTYELAAREVSTMDEPLSIVRTDQPTLADVASAASVRAVGVPTNAQPLHPLLIHPFWGLIGHNVFVLRFTSVLFGVCSLALAYKAGELLFDRRVALVTALLLALFPLHLRYAQTFRFYAPLVTFTLASLVFLWQALKTNRPGPWIGFIISITLAVYTHYNALFVLAAEGFLVAVIWVRRLATALKSPSGRRTEEGKRLLHSTPPRSGAERAASWVMAPVLAFAAVVLLTAPALMRLIGMPWMLTSGNGGTELATSISVQWTLPYFRTLLGNAGLITSTAQVLLLSFVLLGLLYTLYRGHWQQALLLVLWILLAFVVLSFFKTPDRLRVRHVIYVVPAMLLLVAQGAVGVGEVLDRLLARLTGRPLRTIGLPLIAALLALVFALLLPAHYAYNRDWQRLEPMVAFVERHAQAGDVVIVSPRVFLRPLRVANVVALDRHLSPGDMARLTAAYDRVWVIHSSFLPDSLRETIDLWVADHDFLSFGVGNTIAVSYRDQRLSDRGAILSDRISLMEEVITRGLLPRRGHRIRTIQALAAAYRELGERVRIEGQTTLADELVRKADWADGLITAQPDSPDE